MSLRYVFFLLVVCAWETAGGFCTYVRQDMGLSPAKLTNVEEHLCLDAHVLPASGKRLDS